MERVGLIARAEDRGLGIMTWELARALEPERIVIVAMGELTRGFSMYPERYVGLGDVAVVPYPEMGHPTRDIMAMLRRVDVLYSAETFYDWNLVKLARAEGVRTVCHAMPEFWNHWRPDFDQPSPDEWWLPTPWYADRFPEGTPIVPVPVALDRWPQPVAPNEGTLRVLHIAGTRAAMDRNGTLAFFAALRHVKANVKVTVIAQTRQLPHPRVPKNVDYRVVLHGQKDYWTMYADQDVLVLPRRYGGLSLPVQEACGAGLAIVMPDVEPNRWYPTLRTPVRSDHETLPCAIGDMPVYQPSPSDIALMIDRLAADRDLLWEAQGAARGWAERHSWEALAPEYRARLTP